jgi:type I restriction enzyme, S subunit
MKIPVGWESLYFGDFLEPIDRRFTLIENQEYRLCGVRWYGNGVFIREIKFGRDVKLKGKNIIRTGDVIYNKLFAWRGSYALVENDTNGCCVSDEFPIYHLDDAIVLPRYLYYYFRTDMIRQDSERVSTGVSAASRKRLHERDFLRLRLPVPPLDEQHRIVGRIEAVEQRLENIKALQDETEQIIFGVLLGAYRQITEKARKFPLSEIAPLIRRTVKIEPEVEYPELGLRSWGKGTFHKPAIKGQDLNGKRIYRIESGDLLFSNVFSWEGAVAVAKPEDGGRFGSHRYITRVVKQGIASAYFLYFHFMTEEGLQQLRDASPGSAGRNRTLGLRALDAIKVPVPDFKVQCWFNEIFERLDMLKQGQSEIRKEVDALFPALLDRAFLGEL